MIAVDRCGLVSCLIEYLLLWACVLLSAGLLGVAEVGSHTAGITALRAERSVDRCAIRCRKNIMVGAGQMFCLIGDALLDWL